MAQSSAVTDALGGDAPVENTGGGDRASRKRAPPPQSYDRVHKRQDTAFEGQHNTGSDGQLATNRRGIPLCGGFQSGSCTAGGDSRRMCATSGRHVHQCAKCLSPDHGAWAYQKQIPPLVSSQRQGPGGGEGEEELRAERGAPGVARRAAGTLPTETAADIWTAVRAAPLPPSRRTVASAGRGATLGLTSAGGAPCIGCATITEEGRHLTRILNK